MSSPIKKIISFSQALSFAEELCVKGERSEWEISDKLRRKGIAFGDIEKIIDSLVARRFIDNERFAASFVKDKYRFAKWGTQKIAQALSLKHRIPDYIIRQALAEIDTREYADILLHIMCVKARSIKEGNSYEGRTKLFRFAVSRGFETSLVSEIIRNKSVELWEKAD